jgi:hypothetical protein
MARSRMRIGSLVASRFTRLLDLFRNFDLLSFLRVGVFFGWELYVESVGWVNTRGVYGV